MSSPAINIQLPDLRFEQSFMRTLRSYATPSLKKITSKELSQTDSEVTIDDLEDFKPTPIGQITPSIVIYSVIKDQIIMPFLSGLVWSGFLILAKPTLNKLYMMVVRNGMEAGLWVKNSLALNTVYRRGV